MATRSSRRWPYHETLVGPCTEQRDWRGASEVVDSLDRPPPGLIDCGDVNAGGLPSDLVGFVFKTFC